MNVGRHISLYLVIADTETLPPGWEVNVNFKCSELSISQGQFTFHPKCSELSISYLAFADDLFLLSGADCSSIGIIKEVLDEFFHSSGLKPNLQKSLIFFSGVSNEVKDDILRLLPIPEGSLPVKYLGVPLISTRLKYEDCVQLKENTKQRIESWTNRSLSFGGRALLIQSVLFSMQTYWCSLFVLPQKIVKARGGSHA